MEIGLRDRAEKQQRHGDLEDEFAQGIADIGCQQPYADNQPADENEKEDRKNVEDDG
jgi:hypothetical protein